MTDVSRKVNQNTARRLRKNGVEITPDQVAEERKRIHIALRKKLAEMGFDPPNGEMELIEWMRLRLKSMGIFKNDTN
jgi:Fe2+ transport system protein FeoA